MADVIHLREYQARNNGARDALLAALRPISPDAEDIVDYLLGQLWLDGFIIVPVEGNKQ